MAIEVFIVCASVLQPIRYSNSGAVCGTGIPACPLYISATILPDRQECPSYRKSSSQDPQDMTVCQSCCYIAVILILSILFGRVVRIWLTSPGCKALAY